MAVSRSKFATFAVFLGPYRRNLLAVMGLTVVLSVLAMAPPLIIRAVVDRVITEGEGGLFLPLAVAMLAVPIVAAGMRFIQTIGIAYLGQRFVFDLRVALFDHLLRLSLRFFGKHSVGMLVNRLMGDSGTVQHMLTSQSISIVSDLICAAFAITATFTINWRLAVLLVLIVVVFVLNYRLNIARIRQATRGYQGALDRLSGGVQNRLVASLAVKSFGTERREHGQFLAQSEDSLGLVQQAMVASSTFTMNTNLIQGVGRSMIYFFGCAFVLKGDMSYGDVVAFTTYAMQLLVPAVNFSELARQIQNVGIAIDRLFELYGEPPEIVDGPEAKPIVRLAGQVDFDHVAFHYNAGTPVLEDFDLHIAAGETVALIGPTGCGKSTILSLIMRFYDVCGGALRLDGVDVRQVRLRSLRRQFGIVLQEPLLFSVSVADNIRYGRPGATLAEIEAAARVAEIHDFIVTLPRGYQTMLGSEGVDLSLGQKQRITIARAVVANPAILIMDEATSSLDSESERAIQAAMGRVLKGRTAFIVAHRLSTIRNADRIVLLDRGRIVEMGRHEELMALSGGRYRELYLTHMGRGTLDDEAVP